VTVTEADRCLWQMYRAGLISKYSWTRATREVRRAASRKEENGSEAVAPELRQAAPLPRLVGRRVASRARSGAVPRRVVRVVHVRAGGVAVAVHAVP
jgi:hypothetical protein